MGALLLVVLSAAEISVSVAPGTACISREGLVARLEKTGLVVTSSRSPVLHVELELQGAIIWVRGQRRGPTLERKIPAAIEDCPAVERIVAALIHSWAEAIPSLTRKPASVEGKGAASAPSSETERGGAPGGALSDGRTRNAPPDLVRSDAGAIVSALFARDGGSLVADEPARLSTTRDGGGSLVADERARLSTTRDGGGSLVADGRARGEAGATASVDGRTARDGGGSLVADGRARGDAGATGSVDGRTANDAVLSSRGGAALAADERTRGDAGTSEGRVTRADAFGRATTLDAGILSDGRTTNDAAPGDRAVRDGGSSLVADRTRGDALATVSVERDAALSSRGGSAPAADERTSRSDGDRTARDGGGLIAARATESVSLPDGTTISLTPNVVVRDAAQGKTDAGLGEASSLVLDLSLAGGGALGPTPALTGVGQLGIALAGARFGAAVDLGLETQRSASVAPATVRADAQWATLSAFAHFAPFERLRLRAGAGVRGWRLVGIASGDGVLDASSGEVFSFGGVVWGDASFRVAGPVSVQAGLFGAARWRSQQFKVDGLGTVLELSPFSAGALLGVSIRGFGE